MRGKAVTLTIILLATTFSTVALPGSSGADEPHAPIEIIGDQELRNNACSCVRNPGASGTATDPFIISDWRIQSNFETGILIRDIREEHFVVRDNTVDAEKGIVFVNTGDRGSIVRNDLTFEEEGIRLKNSATWTADNILQGTGSRWGWSANVGIEINGGSPTIKGNLIAQTQRGIDAAASSPRIEENDIVDNGDGIRLRKSASADLVGNDIRLSSHWGLIVRDSAEAELRNNFVRGGDGGIIAKGAAGLIMVNNTVTNQDSDAVRFVDTKVTMFRNMISDNWRGAVGSQTSDLLIQENVFENNGDDAVLLKDSRGTVEGNLIVSNIGTGIALEHSIVHLTDNTLKNNTFGFSIPYESRQTIHRMSGNVVNGVNVDGTIDPQQKRLFYRAIGEEVTDTRIDSGHDKGFSGVLAEQGAMVFYDSSDVLIRNNTFAHNHLPEDVGKNGRALFIKSSSFIRVQSNLFINNDEGVVAVDSRVFVKNVTCDIDIDPPETVCVDARGGFVSVRTNLIAHVDIGIRFGVHNGVAAKGVIADNEIRSTTSVGLILKGTRDQNHDDVDVRFNRLEANARGAILVRFQGTLEGNQIRNSTWAGVLLKTDTNATFIQNEIVANAKGVVDVDVCRDGYRLPCSSGVFVQNRIAANSGLGLRLNDGGSLEGDTIVHNQVGAQIEGRASFKDVNVSANANTGVRVDGRLLIKGSNVSANGGAGVQLEGTLRAGDTNASENEGDGIQVRGRAAFHSVVAFENEGDGFQVGGSAVMVETNTSLNAGAGMRLSGQIFQATSCESSFNHDGVIMSDAMVGVNTDLDINVQPPPLPNLGNIEIGGGGAEDPLWMHDCDIVANAEFAVQASENTRVNATNNFWGKKGPTFDMPLFRTGNVVSNNVVLVVPFWETRAHENPCTVPSTEAVTPPTQGCLMQ